MTRTGASTAQACLLHAEYHPMGDDCLGMVVAHSRQHPAPFSRAAHDDYQRQVEQVILDRHIRAHLGIPRAEDGIDPDGFTAVKPGPAPHDEELEQAA